MDASFEIRPFAFDRVFAVGAFATRPEDLHLQIASLEAEVERLGALHAAELAAARAEAFDTGINQARVERDTALLAAVDALHATIEIIDQDRDETARGLAEDATQVALAAADLLAARALDEAPAAAIDAAIDRVLRQVARGQELLVRVHPDIAPEIERLIADRQGKDRRRLNLQVTPDDTLAPGDARIDWDQGGLALNAAARWEAIRAELATLLPRD